MQSGRQRLLRFALVALAPVAVAVGVWIAVGHDGGSSGVPPESKPVDYESRFAGYKPAPEPNGDLAKVVWPSFVIDAGPEVKRLYVFQVQHGELMRYMPCFCGCGASAGHRSNRDCYVQRVNADGSVVFDSMAPT